jgi:three-Cys-motif partner protein
LPRLKDDGLLTPNVGDWAERKYRLVTNYAQMFATSMKAKWDVRVYIDLFAGAGRARLEGTGAIVAASPTLALGIRDRFDKYIFCEKDEDKLSALKERSQRFAPNVDVTYVPGDVNANINDVLSKILTGRVLIFCFADPYRIRNPRFDTIRSLSIASIDFLLLIPSYMDVNRNLTHYLDPDNTALDDFVGSTAWRSEWQKAESQVESFAVFLVDFLGRQMKQLRYIYNGVHETVLVRSTEKKLPLYHLAFFSRHKLGAEFWKQAMKYSTDQLDLFE